MQSGWCNRAINEGSNRVDRHCVKKILWLNFDSFKRRNVVTLAFSWSMNASCHSFDQQLLGDNRMAQFYKITCYHSTNNGARAISMLLSCKRVEHRLKKMWSTPFCLKTWFSANFYTVLFSLAMECFVVHLTFHCLTEWTKCRFT